MQMFLTSATIYIRLKFYRTTQQCCEVSSLWGKVSAFLAFHNHLSYFGWQKDHIVNVVRGKLLIFENLLRTLLLFCSNIYLSPKKIFNFTRFMRHFHLIKLCIVHGVGYRITRATKNIAKTRLQDEIRRTINNKKISSIKSDTLNFPQYSFACLNGIRLLTR